MEPAPKTALALKKEAISLGLLTNNPTLDTPRKKLISYIDSSRKIKREIGHATILMFGPTGSGKSSTINHMFNLDHNFATTSESYSATREIIEYNIINNSKEYDVGDMSLGVIDSPGLGDTSGLEQDACNLVAIKKFFKKRKQAFPNLILFVINPMDQTFDGPNSSFVRSLKCLKNLELVDKKHPNVVGIMTHVGAYGHRKDKWTSTFLDRKKRMKTLIREHLGITANVVALENQPIDQELDFDGDYSILPDDTPQPKNLYRVCAKLLKKNGDEFGMIAFNTAFIGKPQTPSIGNVVTPKDAKNGRLGTEEKNFLEFCRKVVSGDEQTNENRDDDEHTREEVDGLDMGMRFLAQGYDVFRDETKQAQIFSFRAKQNNFRVLIPECARFFEINETRNFKEIFDNKEQKMQSKMRRFQIGVKVPNHGATQAGIRKSKRKKATAVCKELFNIMEHRIYTVELGSFADLNFEDRFKSAVKDLPYAFENQSVYESFFETWGCHIISRAFCGGSIEVEVNSRAVDIKKMKLSMRDFSNSIGDLLSGGASADAGFSKETTDRRSKILEVCRETFKGGDPTLHHKSTLIDSEKLQMWRNSIKMKPAMLNTDLKLIQISELVGHIDKGKEHACKEAIKIFLENKQAEEMEKYDGNTRFDALLQPEENRRDCFPGSAIVQKKTNGAVLNVDMKNLMVGDLIGAKKGFSKVLLFAHYAPEKNLNYLKIRTVDGHCLRVSGNHLVFITEGRSKLAKEVQPGDELINQDKEKTSKVVSVEEVSEVGLFCPVTEDGTIYVDGILTSCYASCKPFFNIDAHHLAHLGLLPMRIVNMKSGQVEEMHPYVKFLDKLPLPFRV